MPFTPDQPFEKTHGDVIRSKDWNDAIKEVQRLGTDKISRSNDTVPGPLVISGTLGFGAQVRQMINLWQDDYGIGIQSSTQYFRTARNFAWYKGGAHNDAALNTGGGTVQMVIDDGRVGIGKLNPQSALDVNGAIRAGNSDLYFTATNHSHTGTGNTTGFAAIENAADYGALMILGRAGTARGRYVRLWDYLQVVGTLETTGTAIKPGGGSWSSTSDANLKQNIQPLRGALDRLLRLRGVSFEWKEPEQQGNQTGPQIGMVAQEVEKVFPQWVGETSEGTKMLSITGFEALVVEALRELDARIAALEAAGEEPDARPTRKPSKRTKG